MPLIVNTEVPNNIRVKISESFRICMTPTNELIICMCRCICSHASRGTSHRLLNVSGFSHQNFRSKAEYTNVHVVQCMCMHTYLEAGHCSDKIAIMKANTEFDGIKSAQRNIDSEYLFLKVEIYLVWCFDARF